MPKAEIEKSMSKYCCEILKLSTELLLLASFWD